MIFVVDASVAVKWFVAEADREKARPLLRLEFIRYAPDIFFCEVANALSKKVLAAEITEEQASRALDDLSAYVPYVCPTNIVLRDAFDLSLRLKHPVPDCLYLACARHLGAVLVSADRKFMDKCAADYGSYCISLDAWSPPELQRDRLNDLDADLLIKLAALQASYDQTKRRALTRMFDYDEVSVAEEKLVRALASFDTDDLAHLTALGWLGALDPKDKYDESLREIWLHYLTRARASWTNSEPRANLLPNILPSLGYLSAGLRYLSRLGSQTPDPRNV